MNTARLVGTCAMLFTAVIVPNIAASARVSGYDVVSTDKSIGVLLADRLNPQPLPPRCTSPNCKPGGGGKKVRLT